MADKCIICGKPVYAQGFCRSDYIFLQRNRLLHSSKEIQIQKLNEKYIRKSSRIKSSKKGCLFCGAKPYARGFCTKHYLYLFRRNIDFHDVKKCLKMLNMRDKNRNYGSETCVICGNKAKSKGLCSKHYMRQYRASKKNIDIVT